jgi:hypothetical protein
MGGPYSCAEDCPDLVFSPGSTRTVDILLECAEVYATLPCEDVLAYLTPPCVTPGTKQLGEPCRYASQCESLNCKYAELGSCGVCVRTVGENEDCGAADADCRADLVCVEAVCLPLVYGSKALGEPCGVDAECDGEAYCGGVCVAEPVENESCAATNHCASAFYCAEADHICRTPPGLGEPCGNAAGTSYPACAEGVWCTAVRDEDPGTCEEPVTVARGDDCSGAELCPTGTACACPDETCAAKRCAVERLIDESCGNGEEVCYSPLDCVDGVCVPPPYQGKYEDACGS